MKKDNTDHFIYESEIDQSYGVSLEFVETIHQIYEKLADDVSKQIFTNRLLYNFTKDYKYIKDIVLTLKEGKTLEKLLYSKKDVGVYIYGAGKIGNRIKQIFSDVNWIAYIDREKEGICNDIPIEKLSKFQYKDNALVLVSNMYNSSEIKKELIEYGILEKNIVVINDIDRVIQEKMYFEDFINISEGSMVDGGSYDGGDVIKYLKFIRDDKHKFYAFEPDIKNYEVCKHNLSIYNGGIVINDGLSDKIEKKSFCGMLDTGSYIGDSGDMEISLTTIDSLNDNIGFIKMDVEGSEKKALKGGIDTIKKCAPVMAISVYHKMEDIWEIPKLLLEFNSNYKFYLRHYSLWTSETVLYAMVES